MFLKSLIVQNGSQIIRNIPFHKGINLIIDETPSNQKKTDSGNSVGKTTVLRLIDFCLDGSDKNIYIDPEFKTHNEKIERYLKDNNIIVTLVLSENIEDENAKTLVIERNFLSRTKKIQRINGEKYPNDEFSKKLKSFIFNTTSDKPTFKQLKSKNIRDEKNKLINTIRVLSPYDTDVAYETLHLFWFGIDVDLSKDKLIRDRNLEEKLQTRLRKGSNLPQINQSLIIVNKEITELTLKKNSFNLNTNYEKDLESLNNIKREINAKSSHLSRLEMRKSLFNESKLDLEKDFADVDVSHIKKMYDKAKSFMPNLQKSFEETLIFHNGMIREKILFIGEELPLKNAEIKEGKTQINLLLSKENKLTASLNKSGAIEELQEIIYQLNEFYEKKGRLEEQKSIWKKSNYNLTKINKKLDVINIKVTSKDDLIQEKIAEFNVFFAEISSQLDGVHSLLSADNEKGVYKFTIANIEGNPGTGSKKSQMASFDLA